MARFTCVGSTRYPDAIEACFITLPNASLPFLCVVTKLLFLLEQKNFFSKKLLYFSVKSVILYPTRAPVGYKAKRRAFLSGTPVVHPSIIMLFSSFTFLSFTLPVPQGTRKAMTHLHGSSLFLLPTGGQSTSRKSTALQDDVPQLLFPVPPQKVCLNKHPCFFLTSLCMRVILISVN